MKIKIKVLQNILQSTTAKEIDFILFICRYQNKHGVIHGITKNEVCEALSIHKSTFYEILYSLERKQIIFIDWTSKHSFWNIKILNNEFWSEEDTAGGYINLNANFLYSPKFTHLTLSEKTIVLKLYCLFRDNRHAIPITINKLVEWTGRTKQSIHKYIQNISKLIDLKIQGNTVYFTVFNAFSRYHLSEADIYNRHLLNYIARQQKATYTEEEYKDTIKLLKIYKEKPKNHLYLLSSIFTCIKNKKSIIAKYINSMLQRAIKADKQNIKIKNDIDKITVFNIEILKQAFTYV